MERVYTIGADTHCAFTELAAISPSSPLKKALFTQRSWPARARTDRWGRPETIQDRGLSAPQASRRSSTTPKPRRETPPLRLEALRGTHVE